MPIIDWVLLPIDLYQAFEAWYWNPCRDWPKGVDLTPEQVVSHFNQRSAMGFGPF